MKLFTLGWEGDTTTDGYVDFTTNIVAPNYKVNMSQLYEEYTDVRKVTHRQPTRTQVSGTFTLKFYSMEDRTTPDGYIIHGYQTFLDKLEKYKAGMNGLYYAGALSNNTQQFKNAKYYIEFAPKNTIPYFDRKNYDGFEVKITER